ncbi:MAG: transglutaminase domain-containing protein [Kiritimatiellia bacterium]|nr:transglutaminase domain-containing protein [Kiritimatiellia bacterium]
MWIDPKPGKRPWSLRVLSCILLGCGSAGLVLMLRWQGFLWFAGPLLLPVLVMPRPLVYMRLRSMLLVFGAVISFMVIQAIAPIAPFQPEMLGRLDVVCPIILSIGAVAALHELTAMNRLLLVGSSYGLMILSGLSGMAFGIEYNKFAFVTAAYVIALVALMCVSGQRRASHRKLSFRLNGLRYGMAVICIAIAASLMPSMRTASFNIYGQLVSASTQMFRVNIGVRTGKSLNLRRTVPKNFRQRTEVLIRIVTKRMPAYLRGQCYDKYVDGNWISSEKPENVRGIGIGEGEVMWFPLSEDKGTDTPENPLLSTDVYLAPAFESHVIHIPAYSDGVGASTDLLKLDAHGSLYLGPTETDEVSHYQLTDAGPLSDFARQTPPGNIPEACLDLPEPVRGELVDIAESVFSSDGGATRQKLEELSSFFNKGFSYELGVRLKGRTDPVVRFLKKEKRGHCSLFAAASALLLRTQGIPARVVCGFVCSEMHPSGTYWVVRENTAHAWVEAFCEEEKRWVLVENTPADGLPSGDSEFGMLSSSFDQLRLLRQRLANYLKGLQAGGVFAALISGIAAALVWLFSKPYRPLAIFTIVAVLVGIRWLRRRGHDNESKAERDLRLCRESFEVMFSKFGLTREKSQTLAALARLMDTGGNVPLHADVHNLARVYERLRYGGETPDPEAAAELRERVCLLKDGFSLRNTALKPPAQSSRTVP